MTRRDVERYIHSRTGVSTTGERERTTDNIVRYREEPDTFQSSYPRGYFIPDGTIFGTGSEVTSLATGVTAARYLGRAPGDRVEITVCLNVTTALSTTTWAEVAIATAGDALIGVPGNLSTNGFKAVGAVMNSVGIKLVTVDVNIAEGAHCYVLIGSAASVPFQVRGALGDQLNMGYVQFATAQPSIMANPTAFVITTLASRSALVGVSW